jgi:hypothetical protein
VHGYQEGRFDTIPLANSNLPAIAKERILKPRDENARQQIDEAFAQTASFASKSRRSMGCVSPKLSMPTRPTS